MKIQDPIIGIDTEPEPTLHIEQDAAAPAAWVEVAAVLFATGVIVVTVLKLLGML